MSREGIAEGDEEDPDLPVDLESSSHAEIRKELVGVRDPEVLERLLEAERDGMAREGVEELIERKIDVLPEHRTPDSNADEDGEDGEDGEEGLGELFGEDEDVEDDPPSVMLVRHEVGPFVVGCVLAGLVAGLLYASGTQNATGSGRTAAVGALVLGATGAGWAVAADGGEGGVLGDLVFGGVAGGILGGIVGWVAFGGMKPAEWVLLFGIAWALVGLTEGAEGLVGGAILGAISGAVVGFLMQRALTFVTSRPPEVVVLAGGGLAGVLALAANPGIPSAVGRRSSTAVTWAVLGGVVAGGATAVGPGPALFVVGVPALLAGTVPASKLRKRRRAAWRTARDRIADAEGVIERDGEAQRALEDAEAAVEAGRFGDAMAAAERASDLAERENRLHEVTGTLLEELDADREAHDLAERAREALTGDVDEATDLADRAVESALEAMESAWSDAQRRALELTEDDGPDLEAGEYDRIAEGYAEVVETYERVLAVRRAADAWGADADWSAGEVEADLDDAEGKLRDARENRQRARVDDARDRAQRLVSTAEGHMADERFERARAAYEDAESAYGEAVELAQGLPDRVDDTEAEVEAVAADRRLAEHLADVEREVRTAERDLDAGEFDDARAGFDSAFDRLEEVDGSRFDGLFERVQRGRIEARIGAAEDRIERAESMFEDGDHYAARNEFEAVQDDLEGTPLALANELGDEDLIGEIGRLSERCDRRSTAARREMFGAAGVDAGESTVPVGDVADVRETVEAADVTGGELPDHDVIETIGSGGNADVHRIDVDGEEFALKVPRFQGTLSGEVVESFVDEAETWSRVDDHDNVVSVEDWGTLPYPWIMMEYADAGNLADRVGDVSLGEALDLAADVVDGVWHAHRHGIVHLDLKPENVLLAAREGRDVPKVGDWGLSKTLLDHSGSVEGLTPQYAAPEQFRAEEYGGTDERTDVYQLGAILYELFVGDPPFEGDQTTVMYDVLEADPDPPSERDPTLPRSVDDILSTALEKGKDDRYESVLYLRDELRDLADSL